MSYDATDRSPHPLGAGDALLIGKRPLIVAVEPWGLRLREKGRRRHGLYITWAQVWNRSAVIAAERKRAEGHGSGAPELT